MPEDCQPRDVLQAASRSHSRESEEKRTPFPVTAPRTPPTAVCAALRPQLPSSRAEVSPAPTPAAKPPGLAALPAGESPPTGYRALERRRSRAPSPARPPGPRAHLLAEAADLALAQLPALVQLLDPLVQLLGETLLLHGGGGGGATRRVGPGRGPGRAPPRSGPATPGPA